MKAAQGLEGFRFIPFYLSLRARKRAYDGPGNPQAA